MASIKIVYPKATSVAELAQLKLQVKQYYNTHLKGKIVVNKERGVHVRFSNVGRNHVLFARAVGFEKLIAVIKLDEMIQHATLTNFKGPDADDHKDIIGYMNFKVSVSINGASHPFRIVVRISKDGKFFYDHSVRVKK